MLDESEQASLEDSGVGLTRRDLLGAGAAIGAAALLDPSLALGRVEAAPPKRGGRLRVGFVGRGQSETFDTKLGSGISDAARIDNMFDRLATLDSKLAIRMELATEFVPNRTATVWQIRLRRGVEWHDGKPFTADDVIYSIRYTAQAAHPGAPLMAPIDVKRLRKANAYTVVVPLNKPVADLPSHFVHYWTSIVQNGATDFTQPVGTGPFAFSSFTPGQSTLLERNPNYWRSGRPYVAELEFQSIPDGTARLNALLSGRLDAVESLTYSQAAQQKRAGRISILEGKGPFVIPFTMFTDTKPFSDLRVRQAMRLIVDRPALLKTVQLGFGEIANDLFGKGLRHYHSGLPQREQDLERAKSLLRSAGHSSLNVTLATSSVFPAMLSSAIVFQQQAKKAGVNVKLDIAPADQYWSTKYLKSPFAFTAWQPLPLPVIYNYTLTPASTSNETRWKRQSFAALLRRAEGELNERRARQLWNDLQEIQWREGGYIMPTTTPWLDGVAKRVRGVVPNGFFPLSAFKFADWWLA